MSFDSEDETPESLAYFKAQASERAVESWNRLSPQEQQEMQRTLDELLSEDDAEDAQSVNDQYTNEIIAQGR